jgi:ribosomal protein S18 acetylase RimI-like enzyme
MPQEIIITRGFPDERRSEASALFDAAFGPKLSRAIPDQMLRLKILESALDPWHAFVAMSGGQLIGIAGFKTKNGSLTSGITARLLIDKLGILGALRAIVVLALFQRSLRPSQLLMDGISVAPTARGGGIGTKLLLRIKEFAEAEGYQSVRLDVIDTNHAARRLYEREGFIAISTYRFPYLRWFLDFSAATTLEFRIKAI